VDNLYANHIIKKQEHYPAFFPISNFLISDFVKHCENIPAEKKQLPNQNCHCSFCESLSFNDTSVDGKVVLCFTTVGARAVLTTAASAVREAGGVGVIVARNPSDMLGSCGNDFPCVVVDYELVTQILFYIRSARYQNHCQCYRNHKFQLT